MKVYGLSHKFNDAAVSINNIAKVNEAQASQSKR